MSSSISLSNEQVKLVLAASEPIPVRDPQGQVVGWLMPRPGDAVFTSEEVSQAAEDLRSGMPVFTTAEVLARLHELEQA